MEVSSLIIICGVILALFGTADGFIQAIGSEKVKFIYFLICLLALSGLTVPIIQELVIEPAPILLMQLALCCKRKKTVSNLVATLCLALFCAGIMRIFKIEGLSYILAAFIGVISLTLYREPGNAILLSAFVMPIALSITALYELIIYNHAELDMRYSELFTLQLISASIGSTLCSVRKYTYKLIKRRIA